MRRINGRFLAGLIVVVVLLAAGIHLLHRFQVRRTSGALLTQADRAEQRGEPAKAVDYLDRYLNLTPGDADAMARYALLLASDELATSMPAKQKAAAAFERVLILAPGRGDIRRKLADLSMELGDVVTARTHLEILLQAKPNDGDLEYQLGQCMEGLGQLRVAADWYEKARTHAKDKVDAYARLAAVLRKLERPDQADQVMDAVEVKNGLIAANGQSFRAYLARAAYRKANGLAGADQDVARALSLAPDQIDAVLAAAEVAATAENVDEARAHLKHALTLDDQDVRTYQALAALEARSGRSKEAVAWLERAVAAHPQQIDLRWTLADFLLKGDDFERAEPIIAELRKTNLTPAVVDYLNAELLIRRGRWDDAAATLEPIAAALNPNLAKRAYLLLGECFSRTGKTERRHASYRQAASISGTDGSMDLAAQLGLASSLAAENRLDEAIREYRKIQRRSDAPPEIPLVLARLLVLENQRLPRDERQWDDAEQAVDAARKQQPTSLEPMMLGVEVLAGQGKMDEARRLALKARDLDPKQAAPWIALAAIDQKAGRADQARRVLDEAAQNLDNPIEVRLARARYWADFDGDGDTAVKGLAALRQGLEALPTADRQRLLGGLAAAYANRGDLASARPLWEQLATEQPDNLAVRFTLFETALQANDLTQADQLLTAIQKIEGQDGPLWRFGRASLLIRKASEPARDRSGLDEARRLLAEAARLRPAWSRIPSAEGLVNDLQGQTTAALKSYQHAIDLGDRSLATVQRTCQILYGRRRYAEAEKLLQKLDQSTLPAQLQRLAADLALKTGAYQRGLEQARQAVPADSKNETDALWLGQVLWNAAQGAEADGRRDEAAQWKTEAGQQFRKAVKLAGDAPGPWIALVQYLAASGLKAEAEAAIDQARTAIGKGRAPLAVAQCYELIGQADRASKAYQEAREAQPDDPAVLLAVVRFQLRQGRLGDAEPLLQKLTTIKGLAAEDAATVRRALAVTLAVGGNPQRSAQALKLLEETAKTDPALSLAGASPGAATSLADRRTRARVLAMQKDRAHRDQAIAVLESLVALDNPSPEDRFLLVQLYEAGGDWPKARQQMLDLLASDGKNPGYLAHYTRSLVRRDQLDEAGVWLARLEKLQPNSPAVLELRARMLKARDQGGDAAALLSSGVASGALDALPVAALLEELGQFTEAESMYRQYADGAKDPKAPLTLAGFLGRRNRATEALDLCDAAWKTCPPEVVSNACVAVLYTAEPADDALCTRVKDRISAAIKTFPDLISLQFDLANVLSLQRRYDEAEAIYRTLLANDKTRAAALNNLAWLLALQGNRGSEALPLIQRAIENSGASPDLLDTRAMVYLAQGRTREALQDLKDAAAVKPSADVQFHLALAHLKAGDQAEARDAFREARAQGLSADGLHPLERDSYRQLNELSVTR